MRPSLPLFVSRGQALSIISNTRLSAEISASTSGRTPGLCVRRTMRSELAKPRSEIS